MQHERKIQELLAAQDQSEMNQWNMTFKNGHWDLELGLRSQHTGKRGIWDSVIWLLKAVRSWLTPEVHDYVKGQWSRHSNQVLHSGAPALYNHFHLGSKRSRSVASCFLVIGFKGKFQFRGRERWWKMRRKSSFQFSISIRTVPTLEMPWWARYLSPLFPEQRSQQEHRR